MNRTYGIATAHSAWPKLPSPAPTLNNSFIVIVPCRTCHTGAGGGPSLAGRM